MLGVSLAVHSAIALVRQPRAPSLAQPVPMSIELTVVAPVPTSPVTQPPEGVPESQRVSPRASTALRHDLPTPALSSRSAPNLNPRALTWSDAAGVVGLVAPPTEPPSKAAASDSANPHVGFLREHGTTKRYLSKRPAPDLKRRGDGTYRYKHHLFTATIHHDGSVWFESATKFRTGSGLGAVLDVYGRRLRKRGEDSDRYEKEWFLRVTQVFRDRLADEQRDRDLALSRLKAATPTALQ